VALSADGVECKAELQDVYYAPRIHAQLIRMWPCSQVLCWRLLALCVLDTTAGSKNSVGK